ncbi:hypothetical protein [Kribbella sp. NPDC006257]|uniref:hypothetical protein n=1 Tax=Kribbella sp. NPDC006257 TaxID=3156738 RepID=UPI0033B14003
MKGPRPTDEVSSQIWRSLFFTALGLTMTLAGVLSLATGTGSVGVAITLLSVGVVLVVGGAYRRRGQRP